MLDKFFDPAAGERRISASWSSRAAAAGPDAAPFTVMMPPPNVTGTLHAGHALDMTLQDILVRHRRMLGQDVLWQAGTDHAGIATQMVVQRQLDAAGIDREAIGREAFVARVWDWKATSGGRIGEQLRRLGASADWDRERFTMDDGLSRAVRETFVRLHREGIVSRARRMVNWDPSFRSAISDLEVESREVRGSLWHIRYPVEGDDGRTVVVATTRPETMLGDTAVAVHPTDGRYADLVGRFVILPLTGRRIPVVADEYSDPEKGTGAVKITPAHDFNDFKVGERHGLAMPTVLDEAGRVALAEIEADLPAEADFVRALAGVERDEARARIVAELERLDLLDRIEPHVHQVPHAERGGAVVEPRLTVQWYCDAARLAGPAIAAVEDGRTRFVPRQWENTFFAWLRDIQPWCISRQLWWGHRIPAWYGPDGQVFVSEDEAGAMEAAAAAYGPGVVLVQDEDVLDTWFSSGLWPFSTLGWPDDAAELRRRYPTDVLVTGFDIIFFWVARMMMLGLHLAGDVPFREVVIHGLVRDERGRKMSKSLNNGLDPIEIIDQFGADALRFAICSLAGQGRDIRLGLRRVEEQRPFVTKLWNAARFAEANGVSGASLVGFEPAEARGTLARWILDEAGAAVAEADAALSAYRFDEYAAALYRFSWNRFCDWFLELAKPVFAAGGTEAEELRAATAHVLSVLLRLLHPVVPFVTEALWGALRFGAEGTLIAAPWPEAARLPGRDAVAAELDWVLGLIGEIRTIR
ncbi:MAG: valine--tRNA ligase, partial [Gluconacetobacter diazotrophicus]|nr:valine--tRNA ligase [Gluconacetobacter diazotrophicus]